MSMCLSPTTHQIFECVTTLPVARLQKCGPCWRLHTDIQAFEEFSDVDGMMTAAHSSLLCAARDSAHLRHIGVIKKKYSFPECHAIHRPSSDRRCTALYSFNKHIRQQVWGKAHHTTWYFACSWLIQWLFDNGITLPCTDVDAHTPRILTTGQEGDQREHRKVLSEIHAQSCTSQYACFLNSSTLSVTPHFCISFPVNPKKLIRHKVSYSCICVTQSYNCPELWFKRSNDRVHCSSNSKQALLQLIAHTRNQPAVSLSSLRR